MIWARCWLPVLSQGDASVPSVVVALSRVRCGSERGAGRWLLSDRLQLGLAGARPFRGWGAIASLPLLLPFQSLECAQSAAPVSCTDAKSLRPKDGS